MDQVMEDLAGRQVEQQRQPQFSGFNDYLRAVDSMINCLEGRGTQKSDSEMEKPKKAEKVMQENLKSQEKMSNGQEKMPENNPENKADSQKHVEQKKSDIICKKHMTKINAIETNDNVEIKIEFSGRHKFKGEDLDVQVVNGEDLLVQAEAGDQKFEKKFKLASNCQVDNIVVRYKEDQQHLSILVPKKSNKVTQIPIAIDE
jgi:HSP20 family molecular chaperone IbpA